MQNPLVPVTIFHFGPLAITETVVTTWGIVTVLACIAWLAGRAARRGDLSTMQVAIESIVTVMRNAVAAAVPAALTDTVLPFIATFWIFLVAANLAGIIPGLHSPTADISATSALAILVFSYVHVLGIRVLGVRGYMRHYLSPSPLLMPFQLVSEITRTITLAVRLFGNMMSLEMAAMMALLLAGFLIPVPVLMLHVVEALIQAYIFGMLALVYIGGAVVIQQQQLQEAPA